MKTKLYLPISLIIISLSIFACHQSSKFNHTNAINKNRIIGQTAPPDMVFIPGNADIPSFYMGVSEEPNINYLIYLRWLKSTFNESYPEVYQDALPKENGKMDVFQFNDPYNYDYLRHPAFSYYPVTGLSWLQIQNYLAWKTDRLNEAVLIRMGIMNFNPEQKDEDNFVTEAYLNGQYQGDVRKNLKDNRTGGERTVAFNDGILFAGFRLPTEAEWEFASQARFQKKIDRKKCLDPLSKVAINHPYGTNYFALIWGNHYEEIGKLQGHHRGRYYSSDTFEINQHRNIGFDYTPNDYDRAGTPQRLTSIGDYNPQKYGLINMETNVREWLLDSYEDTFDETQTDLLSILEKSGFKIKDAAHLDERGSHVEKDSLGRMRYFRVLDVAFDGKPQEVGVYQPEYLQNRKELKLLEDLKYLRTRRLNAIQNGTYAYESNREKALIEIKKLEEGLQKFEDQEYRKRMAERRRYQNYNVPSVYNLKFNLKRQRIFLLENDSQLLQRNLAHLDEKINKVKEALSKRSSVKRVIKGGTWQQTGKERISMDETKTDLKVGFRCVLPYTGIPAEKKFKVSWE